MSVCFRLYFIQFYFRHGFISLSFLEYKLLEVRVDSFWIPSRHTSSAQQMLTDCDAQHYTESPAFLLGVMPRDRNVEAVPEVDI